LVAADNVVILCRVLSGTISAGHMDEIKNNPIEEKARARKSNSGVARAILLPACEYLINAA
jgi:hypothetical protein